MQTPDLSGKFDFNTAITEDSAIYAKWTKNSDAPGTGDNSNMALWIALLLIIGAAASGNTAYRKKRRFNNR